MDGNVRFDRIVEDDSKTVAFGVHPRMRVPKWMLPPMQPIASQILEVRSRKDRQINPNCKRRAFARMMVALDMHRVARTAARAQLPLMQQQTTGARANLR